MSARSRSSSVLLLSVLLTTHVQAGDSTTWSIKDDRTNASKHGLFEVQAAAREFVEKENKRLGTNLVTGEPDLRIVVPPCEVPLDVKWKTAGSRRTRSAVTVHCRKADPKHDGQKRWDIEVLVFKPLGRRGPASSPR